MIISMICALGDEKVPNESLLNSLQRQSAGFDPVESNYTSVLATLFILLISLIRLYP
jgi:hypothetical protein